MFLNVHPKALHDSMILDTSGPGCSPSNTCTLSSHVLNSSDSNQKATDQPTLFPPLSCSHPPPRVSTQSTNLPFFSFFSFSPFRSETFCILFILKTIYKGDNNILWLLASVAPGSIHASLQEQHTPRHVQAAHCTLIKIL